MFAFRRYLDFLNGLLKSRLIVPTSSEAGDLRHPNAPQTRAGDRPARQVGFRAAGSLHVVPDFIRKIFHKGWKSHIPLPHLTDAACRAADHSASSALHENLVLDAEGKISATPKALSAKGELIMTFDDWHSAWRRLLALIREFIPDELSCWEAHFSRISDADNRSRLWSVWLAYDTKIRKLAVFSPLDPAIFHHDVWNELEMDDLSTKASESGTRAFNTWLLSHPASRTAANTAAHRSTDSRSFPTINAVAGSSNNTSTRGDRANERGPTSSFRPNKCFVCGDTSSAHFARTCDATRLISGQPCHIQKRRAGDTTRVDGEGNSYCYVWNGRKGCMQGATCTHGKHWCTLCGSAAHAAPACTIV